MATLTAIITLQRLAATFAAPLALPLAALCWLLLALPTTALATASTAEQDPFKLLYVACVPRALSGRCPRGV